jgi:hypothetical protein
MIDLHSEIRIRASNLDLVANSSVFVSNTGFLVGCHTDSEFFASISNEDNAESLN